MDTKGIKHSLSALVFLALFVWAGESAYANTITIGSNNPRATYEAPNNTNVEMFQFHVAYYGLGTETFQWFRITDQGTGAIANISNAYLYEDVNADGVLDGSDILIQSRVSTDFSGRTLQFTVNQNIPEAGKDFLVVYSFSGAVNGATYRVSWLNNTDARFRIQWFFPFNVWGSGAPVQGNIKTISTTGVMSIYLGTNSPPAQNVPSTGTNVEIFQLELFVEDIEGVNTISATFNAVGTADDSSATLTAVDLYNDVNSNGTLDLGTDTLYRSGTYSGDDGTITFSVGNVARDTSLFCLLIYDISGAVLGNTYSAQVNNADVSGTNAVSGGSPTIVGGPVNSNTMTVSGTGSLSMALGVNSPENPNSPYIVVADNVQDKTLIQVALTAGPVEDVEITSITFRNDYYWFWEFEANDVDRICLYRDNNGDGILQVASEPQLGSDQGYNPATQTVTFNPADTVDRDIPAGSTVNFIVIIDLSGNASNYENIRYRFQATTDIAAVGVTSANPITPSGSFPLQTPDYTLVSDSIAVVTFAEGASSPGPTDRTNSDQDVEVLQFTITPPSVRNATVNSLSFDNTGTGVGNTDIDSGDVELYLDVNEDGTLDGGDTYLGNGTFNVSERAQVTIPGGRQVDAGDSETWLLVYSFNGSASTNETFTGKLVDPGIVGDVTLDNPIGEATLYGVPITSSLITIKNATLNIAVGSNSPVAQTIANDVQNHEMFQVALTAGAGWDINVTSITFNASGTGDESTDIDNAKLYLDNDDDGELDDPGDTLLGTQTFSVDNGGITFSGLTEVIGAGTTENWLLVYNFKSPGVASDDETFVASISDNSNIVADYGGTPLTPTGAPISGATMTITGVGTITFTAGSNNPGPKSVAWNDTDVVVLQLNVEANSVEDIDVTQIVITHAGTGTPSVDLTQAELWVDEDGDGVLDNPGDTLLDTSTFSGTQVTFNTFTQTVNKSTDIDLIVVYDFNVLAPLPLTYTASLNANSDVTAQGQDSLLTPTRIGAPVSGGTATASSVTSLSIAAGANNPADSGRDDAETDVEMIQLALTAGSAGAVDINSITFSTNGSGDESTGIVNPIELWYDSDGDGDTSDEVPGNLIGSNAPPADNGTFTFSFAPARQITAGATENWIVVYDFSAAGVSVGDDFQTELRDNLDIDADDAGGGGQITPNGAPVNGQRATITGLLTVSVGSSNPGNTTIANDDTEVGMIQINLAANADEDIDIEALTIDGSGSGVEQTDVGDVYLVNDTDGDGVYDTGTDTLIGSLQQYSADNGAVTFAGLTETITAGTSQDWLIVYDYAGTAVDTATFVATFSSVSNITASGASSGSAVRKSGGPVSGGTFSINSPPPASYDDERVHLGLNETSGTTANDETFQATHGTLTGFDPAPPWSGTSLTFDGSDDYINIGDESSLRLSDAITLDAWINATDLTGTHMIISKADYGTNDISYALYTTGTALGFLVSGNGQDVAGGDAAEVTSSAGTISTGTWIHVSATYDGTDMKLFIDAEEVATVLSGTIPSSIYVGSAVALVGADQNGASYENFFEGSIDETRVLEFPRQYYDTRLVLHLNESSGSVAEDTSGFNNDGLLANNPTVVGSSETRYDNGREFNGSSQYGRVLYQGTLDITDDIALGAWIKPASLSGTQTIVAKYNDTGTAKSYKLALNGSNVEFTLSSDGTTDTTLTSSGTLTVSELVHVAGSWDGTTMRIYIDGTQDVTTQPFAGPIYQSATDVTIACSLTGAAPGSSTEYYTGVIDEMRVWNIARRGIDPGIVINEVFYEDDGSNNEFVELYNGGNSTVDIQGWKLVSKTGTFFTLPTSAPINISPGDWYVIENGSTTAPLPDPDIFTGRANGTSNLAEIDSLALYSDSGLPEDETTIIDFIAWGGPPTGGQFDYAMAAGIWGMGNTKSGAYVLTASPVGTIGDGNDDEELPDLSSLDQTTKDSSNGGASPNAVELISFTAEGYDQEVRLEWETAVEINNLGFNVYRSLTAAGPYVQINKVLLLGLDTSDRGGRYLFIDLGVTNDVEYYYILEDVEWTGACTLHGPVSALPQAGKEPPVINRSDYVSVLSSEGDIAGDMIMEDNSAAVAPQDTGVLDIASSGVRVLFSDADRMVLEIIPPPHTVEKLEYDGEPYHRISIEGYGWTRQPGHPQLPVKGILLEIPKCREVALEILDEDAREGSGYRIYPAPRPRLLENEEVIEEFFRDGEVYARDAFLPTSSVEVGGHTVVEDRALLNVRLLPVSYNPARLQIRYARRILVELRFIGSYREGELIAVIDEGVSAEEREQHVRLAEQEAYKIKVRDDGIQRVSGEDLLRAGLSDPWEVEYVQLFRKGKELAIAVQDYDDDGRFDPEDEVLFWGEGNKGMYSHDSVYWLVEGHWQGERMEEVDASLVPEMSPADTDFFMDTLHLEENRVYIGALPGEGSDHWLWTYAFASGGYSIPATGYIDLHHVADVDADCAVGIALRGFTTYDDVEPDHHIRVFLNDSMIDEGRFDGREEYIKQVSIPQGYLVEGRNTFRVELVGDTDVPYDIIYLDAFDLFYYRHYVSADGKELRFSTTEEGRYFIRGFSSSDLDVYDIADRTAPVRITNSWIIEELDGSYTVVLNAGRRPYLVVERSSLKEPFEIVQNTPSSLHGEWNEAEYLIISHALFVESIQRLADYRSTQDGFEVMLVDVEDIYDEFSFGDFTPDAIKDFLRYARSHWSGSAPSYVLFVGDASYDYKDYYRRGSKNLVPSKLVQTEFFETASDNWYVDLVGDDHMPDMYAGRLAVETPDQVDAIVDKIIGYETAPYTGLWEEELLIAADSATTREELIFEKTAEELVEILPSVYRLTKAYVGRDGPEEAYQKVIDALQSGVILANYNGHGAWHLWSWARIFSAADVEQLRNGDRLPFIVAMNCLNGKFDDPFNTSLAETTVNAEHKGAVAFWSSTGLTTAPPQAQANKELFQQIFHGRIRRIGEATTRAKMTIEGMEGYADVIDTWVLSGDPALKLRLNSPPVAAAGSDCEVVVNKHIVLDGSASHDPDGEGLHYAWRVLRQPQESTVAFEKTHTAHPSFSADTTGEYVVELAVHDGSTQSLPDRLVIDVREPDYLETFRERLEQAEAARRLQAEESERHKGMIRVLIRKARDDGYLDDIDDYALLAFLPDTNYETAAGAEAEVTLDELMQESSVPEPAVAVSSPSEAEPSASDEQVPSEMITASVQSTLQKVWQGMESKDSGSSADDAPDEILEDEERTYRTAFTEGAHSPEASERSNSDQDVEILQFTITSPSEQEVTLNSLVVGNTGTGTAATAVDNDGVELYLDANEDGMLDDGDIYLGSGTFDDSETATVTITGGWLIDVGMTETLLLVYSFNGAAVAGETFNASVSDAGFLEDAGQDETGDRTRFSGITITSSLIIITETAAEISDDAALFEEDTDAGDVGNTELSRDVLESEEETPDDAVLEVSGVAEGDGYRGSSESGEEIISETDE